MKCNLWVIVFIVFPILTANAYSQPNIQGLRLGMKHSEVWKLVQATEWDYESEYDRDEPQDIYTLVATDSFRQFGRASIGDTLYSFEIDNAAITMDRGVCNFFFIVGRQYSHKSVDSLRGALKAALSEISSQFGRPTSNSINLDKFTLDKLFEYSTGEFPIVAEWKNKNRIIQIYLSIDGPGSAQPWISAKAK